MPCHSTVLITCHENARKCHWLRLLQAVTGGSGLDGVLLQPETYQAGLALAASIQQFCAEAGEALIMIFVGMVAPDGIGVTASQAVLR